MKHKKDIRKVDTPSHTHTHTHKYIFGWLFFCLMTLTFAGYLITKPYL